MIAHYWRDLPGPQWFSAANIYADQVARARDGAVFVELGSWKGRSTSCMGVEIANSKKNIKLYAVDHWRGTIEERMHAEDDDVRNDRLFDVFLENVAPALSFIVPLRSDSAEAAQNFADASVDFIYVDAGHSYESVLRDITAWWPRLKAGGTMAGDDWCFVDPQRKDLGVRRAVTEFFSALSVPIDVQPGEPNPEWEQWVVRKP